MVLNQKLAFWTFRPVHHFKRTASLRLAWLGRQIFSLFQNLLDYAEFPKYRCAVPFLPKGRLAIVTDAERDAVDVDAPLTNGVEADGESVWS
jgi:hypothetical protein